MTVLVKSCPECRACNIADDEWCRRCGKAFVFTAMSDIPMPRWCQPQPPRRTRYRLESLDTATAREITRALTPSNRRRAERESGAA